jgi:hypothetical protein
MNCEKIRKGTRKGGLFVRTDTRRSVMVRRAGYVDSAADANHAHDDGHGGGGDS